MPSYQPNSKKLIYSKTLNEIATLTTIIVVLREFRLVYYAFRSTKFKKAKLFENAERVASLRELLTFTSNSTLYNMPYALKRSQVSNNLVLNRLISAVLLYTKLSAAVAPALLFQFKSI